MSPARRIALSVLACLAFAGPASACSFTREVDVFVPDARKVLTPGLDLAHLPALPRVVVDVHSIDRASSMYSCNPSADVDLILKWASPDAPRWEDVGVYISHAGSEKASDVPERPRMVAGVPHFRIEVADSPPGGVLDVEYEIRVIDNFSRIGPVSKFRVQGKANPAEKFEATLKLLASELPLPSQYAYDNFPYALRARMERGEVSLEPCGVYSPYGCGGVESALLLRGEIGMQRYAEARSLQSHPVVCLGFRHPSGRAQRILMTDLAYRQQILAAEWVDAQDWASISAGCAALMASESAREAAAVEAAKIKWKQRR